MSTRRLVYGAIRLPAMVLASFAFSALAFAVLPAVAGMELVPAEGPTVVLEVNKGGLVRLDQPAATVFVANPEISDIQVKSPSLIYLMGKRAGETTLYAVDDQERVLAAFQIHVVHDLRRLRQAVKNIHPAVDLELASVGGAVIVEGNVPSAAVAEDVRRLASRFIDTDGDVVNRLAITAPTQVSLRVRVAEINRTVQKQLGFN